MASKRNLFLSLLRRDRAIAAFGIIVFAFAFALQLGPAAGVEIDFFIYYTGVKLAWAGEWPYDTARIRGIVSEAFPPAPGEPPMESGFFLSPVGFVMLAPWAAVPWPVSRWLWVAASALAAVVCGTLAGTFGRDSARRGAGWGLIVAAILLNPLVWRTVSLGQTGLYVIGCVAAGEYARERGWPWLGTLLWSGCGLKPHLGLALILFTAYQGGVRRVTAVASAVALGVILGAAVLGNPLTVILEYVKYLGPAYKSIGFNRVTNDQILSWNRLVLAVGGPEIELGAPAVLAGFAVAIGLLWLLRVRSQPRPPDSWALAAAVAWMPLVAPIHGYDLVAWALMAPYLCLLADRRRWGDFAFLLALIGMASIPRGVVAAAGWPAAITPVALSYRSVLVLIAAIYFLLRRPPLVA